MPIITGASSQQALELFPIFLTVPGYAVLVMSTSLVLENPISSPLVAVTNNRTFSAAKL